MQLLSSIADLKDIVNKEYIDSILANYVLSANLGALATKDSLAFSDLTSRPSKLSDFTDDVVAGKYLPLSGGTIICTAEEALHIHRENGYVGIKFSNGAVGDGWVGYSNYGAYIYTNGHYLHVTLDGKPCYDNKNLLHSGNYSDYALPITGGTLTGGLTISSGNLIVSAGGGDTVTNKIYPTADNTHSLGQNTRRWSDIKTVLINGGTPIHSGNIGSQSVASADSAKVISDYSNSRITSADVEVFGDSGVRKFIASSYMTSGKPPYDGSILHFSWDTTGGYEHQLFIASDKLATSEQRMAWRGQYAGVWGDWKIVAFTDSNVASATKLQTARTLWGQSFDGTGNVSGTLKNVSWIELTGTNFGIYQGSALNSALTDNDIAFYSQKVYMSGNVGIGTTDPKYTLDVNGKIFAKEQIYTDVGFILRTTDGNGLRASLSHSSNTLYLQSGYNDGSSAAGNMMLSGRSTNNLSSFDVRAAKSLFNGNVGIGTNNPAYNLDVAGSIRTTSSLTIGTIVLTDENGTLKIAGNAYTTGQLATGKAGQAASGGGSVQYWSNEYDMDIGTDVLVSSKEYIGTNTIVGWDLAGSCLNDLYIGYDGYTIWMQGSVDEASDMRLKTVIDAVTLDIRDIAFAPVFNYVFKSRPQGRQMLGSSAQYWQAIAPKAVSENNKGNLAMNYGAIALASVVAVAKKVVTHEEEIAELKSKVQSLETRLANYELN